MTPPDTTGSGRVEPFALVHNAATKSRERVRAKFAIPAGLLLVLLTMGGHYWGTSDIRALKAVKEAIFLLMPSSWEQVQDNPERFRLVPTDYPDYHNLIAAADVVVGKAGGSTVAEVLGHQSKMIYTTQIGWHEATPFGRKHQALWYGLVCPDARFYARRVD